MPEKYNRIPLGPDTERDINRIRGRWREKKRRGDEKRESKSFSHTLLVFSFGGSVV